MYSPKAQRAYFHAAEKRGEMKPSVVKEFDDATPSGAKLPEHVKRMAHGGMACMHCGGDVNEDGYAEGGEVAESDGGTYEEQMRRREETRKREGNADAGADMAELAGGKPKKTGYKVRAYAKGGEVDDDDEDEEDRKKRLFAMAIRRRR